MVLIVATCSFAAAAGAQSYDVLKLFGSEGSTPLAGLIQGTDGNLYGTTDGGGVSGYGTIFKIDTAGATLTTLHSFTFNDGANPSAGLIQGTDGNLYGTTDAGGASGDGTIFKIDTAGATLTTLHSFTPGDGEFPSGLIQGMDGNLYGTTVFGGANGYGTVFKIDTAGTSLTTLHSFTGIDGIYPSADLVQGADENLYGTTNSGGPSNYGTIFKIDTAGTSLTTLHVFTGSDGMYPSAVLIQGTDGNLYGTTNSGGASDYGTIFEIDTAGATLTILHDFTSGDGEAPYASLIQGADGDLYGTTEFGGANHGTIFKIDTAGTTLTTLHTFTGGDGIYPNAGLIQGTDGVLYGTTNSGSVNGYGTIFKIDTAGTTLTTLHHFTGSDGTNPYAGVIQGTDGSLYGTTQYGGASGYGTIFKVDNAGTTLITLHSFAFSDGTNPHAGLIQGTDGNLYGTTEFGSAGGYGTIFKIDTAGTTLTILHTFTFTDGANPSVALIQGTDGILYGGTSGGGANGGGTIFKIDTAGATLTTLHGFPFIAGAAASAGLIQGTDGNLYGTTFGGGASGNGTIFKIDTAGASLTTLHSFAGSDGANPSAGLIQAMDGMLYGTTASGSATGNGTIFKIDTAGAALTTLHSFALTDGASPDAGLIQGADGNLYGTTGSNGPGGYGTIFEIDTAGTTLTTLHGFARSDGAFPSGLIQGTDGNFYGTTQEGGPSGAGVFFRLALCDFNDVPPTDPFYPFICTLVGNGISAGCGGADYCPNDSVTRAQMAVLLLKAKHGGGYSPPPCSGTFEDVTCPGAFAADWIEELYNEAITAGCSVNPLLYCPENPVSRAQMAVFLLKSRHGSSYQPPACSGIFQDVPCPGGFAASWIEELSQEGVTNGCSANPPLYCPNSPNTRAQMAVFLVKAFNLQ